MHRKYRHLFYRVMVLVLLNGSTLFCMAQQGGCPPNIGFENGSFTNWECFSGNVTQTGGINVTPSGPQGNIHAIYDANTNHPNDPYGKFPVNCPNGSRYSIRLGNDINGAQAERVSYTFNIPANQNDYSIIYNYAVVFQNPNHSDFQQPRFTSRVFDVTTNSYVSCGSFEFVASSSLLGFQLSSIGQNVYYKPWSPITINLNGYAGKTIRLEFTNNDCTLGGHFGYAYLDVNENCSTPITGNVYCNGSDSIRLKAPFGFKEYRWYNAGFTNLLGTSNTLLVTPPPAPGTTYALEIVPYPNLGCQDTLYTTIDLSPEAFVMSVKDTLTGCASEHVNLTDSSVTAGSTPGLTYSYFTTLNEDEYVINPSSISVSGTYYIKGENGTGCSDIRAVHVAIKAPPIVVVNQPTEACFPGTVDLTAAAITNGSDAGLSYSYWKDSFAIIQLPDANRIGQSGTFYIKGSSSAGCFNIKPVQVAVADVITRSQVACGTADITLANVTQLNSSLLSLSYWQDTAATVSLGTPQAVGNSGTYYIKATHPSGCSITKPLRVTINPIPSFVVTNPPEVVFPATVNLSLSITKVANEVYTFWMNKEATKIFSRPQAADASGTYFIKGTNQFGCTVTKPVVITINPPPLPKIVAPNAFSPNDDGINDLFKPSLQGDVILYHLKIYNRFGQELFDTPEINRYWNGKREGRALPIGTYYWVFEGIDLYRSTKVVQSGSVTLLR